MKKNILFILIVLLFNQAYSQKNIGVFTGINYSYFTTEFGKGFYAEKSFGLQFGVLYELEIMEKINFRPKLFFSQQGDRTKTTQYTNFTIDQVDYKLSYLNASLDIKFWDKIYLITGPQIGVLINQKHESLYLGKIKSNIDFGINLGVGFKVNNLFFELGLYQGLTKLLEYDNINRPKTNVINGHAKLTVGYNL